MNKEQENRTVLLPGELYSRIEERVQATGFGSVDEYAIFVLEEILKEENEEVEQGFSEEEEDEVKKRLKALGYLD